MEQSKRIPAGTDCISILIFAVSICSARVFITRIVKASSSGMWLTKPSTWAAADCSVTWIMFFSDQKLFMSQCTIFRLNVRILLIDINFLVLNYHLFHTQHFDRMCWDPCKDQADSFGMDPLCSLLDNCIPILWYSKYSINKKRS